MPLKYPKILITGMPGVGKTTLVQRLVTRSKIKSVTGFYTSEIRRCGVRRGFELRTFSGDRQILAHVDIASNWRVGKYKVDVPRFEHFLDSLNLIHTTADLVVIDEIGKMEAISDKFQGIIRHVLSSNQQVLGTVAFKGTGLIKEVKRLSNIKLIEITINNRDRLVDEILL